MHVDHFCQRESGSDVRFRDLTLEMLEEMTKAETDDLAAACFAGFQHGDPRCWDGFDSMSEDAQTILNYAYNVWVDAGHEETIHDPAYNPWLRADHALQSAFKGPIN